MNRKKQPRKNYLSTYQRTSVFIKKWEAYLCFGAIIINIILTLILLLLNIADIQYQRHQENLTEKTLKQLDQHFSASIIYFLVNSVFNIVFTILVYRGAFKSPVTYLFVIFWFIIWVLFSGGVFFVYDEYLIVKIINCFVGIICVGVMSILIYDLSNRRRELDFERMKKRSEL